MPYIKQLENYLFQEIPVGETEEEKAKRLSSEEDKDYLAIETDDRTLKIGMNKFRNQLVQDMIDSGQVFNKDKMKDLTDTMSQLKILLKKYKGYVNIPNENDLVDDSNKFIEVESPITHTNGKIGIYKATNTEFGVVKPDNSTIIANNGTIGVNIQNLKATDSKLGFVKIGNNINVNENGVISVLNATANTKGVVKPDDNTNTINISDGIISVNTQNLTKADTNNFGVIKIGNNSNINNTGGVISVPIATTSQLGVVKPDGNTIGINEGKISVNVDNLPRASNNDFGLIKVKSGNGLSISSGVLEYTSTPINLASSTNNGLMSTNHFNLINNYTWKQLTIEENGNDKYKITNLKDCNLFMITYRFNDSYSIQTKTSLIHREPTIPNQRFYLSFPLSITNVGVRIAFRGGQFVGNTIEFWDNMYAEGWGTTYPYGASCKIISVYGIKIGD